jgi:16S rRNA (cytosine1402-N4)-methyltransferase
MYHRIGSTNPLTMRIFPLYRTAVISSSILKLCHGFRQSHVLQNRHFHMTTTTSERFAKRKPKTFEEENDDDDESYNFLGEFASDYHSPVMVNECVEALVSCSRTQSRIFVDGTLGGGGHSLAILQQLKPGDILFGCDVDPEAIETASDRLKEFMGHDNLEKPLFIPVESNFCNLATTLPIIMHPIHNSPIITDGVDGILLDLGVSSHQIDTAERGFAFLRDGPLDMRMDKNKANGITAADILNVFSQEEIKQILKNYGDEARARAISESIVEHRPFVSTQDLVKAVAAVVPEFAKSRRMGRSATLARVFQSLRIVVNREDEALQEALLNMCPKLVRQGGRLVVLSYHSLEDRATKRVIRDGIIGIRPTTNERDMYGNYIGKPRPWKGLGKGTKATADEVTKNSRARSATLRVAERI